MIDLAPKLMALTFPSFAGVRKKEHCPQTEVSVMLGSAIIGILCDKMGFSLVYTGKTKKERNLTSLLNKGDNLTKLKFKKI